MGGIPKFKDQFYLKKVRDKILKAYIVGKNIPFFRKQIGKNIPYKVSKNIRNAVNNIYKEIELKGDSQSTILLSPAAASFDQFSNFENRGIHFKNLINRKFKQKSNV